MRLTKLVAGGRNKGRFQSFVTRDYHAESALRATKKIGRKIVKGKVTCLIIFRLLTTGGTRNGGALGEPVPRLRRHESDFKLGLGKDVVEY